MVTADGAPTGRPDVSVVVTVDGDAERLPATVNSIRDQTLRNLEILIVNDASTDSTRAVAEKLAAADPRVTTIHLAEHSGGCSRPRNVGLGQVRAPWVLFLDSGDTYERHACKNLLLAAERHDADVVIGRTTQCFVRGGKVISKEELHADLHRGHQVYADIGENPGLLHLSPANDKLYRVELLNRENIRFLEGWLFEDLLFNTEVFATGARIAVIPNLVHHWHVDLDAKRPSITDQRHDTRDVEHRFEIFRRIEECLLGHGRDDLKLAVDEKFVQHDLGTYLRELAGRDEHYQQRFLALARERLQAVDPRAMTSSGTMHRLACHFILRSDLDQLLRVADYMYREHRISADLTAVDERIYWKDVCAADPAEREALDVTDMGWHLQPLSDLHLHHEVTGLAVSGSVLRLAASLTNVLGRLDAGTRIDLRFRCKQTKKHVYHPVVIESWDVRRVRYTAEVDLNAVLPIRSHRQRGWTINARVRTADHVNVSALSVVNPRAPDVTGKLVSIRPRAALVVGDRLECHVTENGNLGLRLVNSSEVGRRIVRSGRRVSRGKPVRKVLKHGQKVSARLRSTLRSTDTKTRAYRLFTRLPIKPGSVIFEAHMGRQYGDSPKYIYESLRASGLHYRPIWSHSGSPKPFPKDVPLVKRESWRYYYEMARAQYWVDNQGFPRQCTKRAGTTYLQTWHGTPLKLMGWDEPQLAALTGTKRAAHEAMIERWDHLVVPNEYFVGTFARSYRYRRNLLRVGSPRNDPLARPIDPEQIAGCKTRLGLPLDRRLVLYAPTFRPRPSRSGPIALALDLAEAKEALGDEWMLLARCHYFDRIAIPQQFRGFARDVGPHDVTELLLVADALVTDYSSIMFDYSILRRPMIFFTYDYDEYMGHRGTYFDLRMKAPGPLVTTTAEVTACLKDIDAVAERHAGELEAFAEQFAQYENGNAADAVVRKIFGAGDPR